MDDDDPTGERASSSAWSVVDSTRSAWSFGEHASSTYSVVDDDARSISSTIDDDVLSVASSRLTDVRSIASSSRSATAIYGDHLLDVNTALTAGAPIPLSRLPFDNLITRRVNGADSAESDAASLVSVNTRRGWPRVAPGQQIPQQRVSPLVHERGSYLDALLRQPSEQPPPSHTAAQAATMQQAGLTSRFSSGWVTLSGKRRSAGGRQQLRPMEALLEEQPVVGPEDGTIIPDDWELVAG